jgi:RND family efflux transporter MFP subunit
LPHPDQPTGDHAGTGRRLQITAVIVAVCLAVGFLVVHHMRGRAATELADTTRAEAAAPAAVVVVRAAHAPTMQALSLPGETAAWYESTIYARVNGYVAKWFVDIGDHVNKGQILATIETPELDAELGSAVAKLKAADAEVRVRQAQAAFAKTTYQRWRDSPRGVVSEQERESKKADFDSTVAQENAAAAEVNVDRSDVDRLTALARFKQVTAPYGGTIIERHIDIGNLVTAGSTTSTTSLYRLSRDDPMRVFVDVPQSVAADIAVGLDATVTANNLPDRQFHGTVARTAHSIDPSARTLRVEVDLPNKDSALVPGMYVQVAFQLKARGLVEVPASAMMFRTRGPQVAIVDDKGVVRFHRVEIARDDGNVVELGAGVSPGDRVVLNISNQIADGDKVAATEQPGLARADTR